MIHRVRTRTASAIRCDRPVVLLFHFAHFPFNRSLAALLVPSRIADRENYYIINCVSRQSRVHFNGSIDDFPIAHSHTIASKRFECASSGCENWEQYQHIQTEKLMQFVDVRDNLRVHAKNENERARSACSAHNSSKIEGIGMIR